MSNSRSQAANFDLGHIGWRYYNQIKKKAVEQEFSWSGLALSLSIAFFIVIAYAQGLSLLYHSLESTREHQQLLNQKIYFLEQNDLINPQLKNNSFNTLLAIKTTNTAALNCQKKITSWS
ncbi:hypothetical protein GW884_00115 [Candidatus Falkowbacteria bacterium]|nr:hypothetical protein [Candidatus Falkowbacteria bacterium]